MQVFEKNWLKRSLFFNFFGKMTYLTTGNYCPHLSPSHFSCDWSHEPSSFSVFVFLTSVLVFSNCMAIFCEDHHVKESFISRFYKDFLRILMDMMMIIMLKHTKEWELKIETTPALKQTPISSVEKQHSIQHSFILGSWLRGAIWKNIQLYFAQIFQLYRIGTFLGIFKKIPYAEIYKSMC